MGRKRKQRLVQKYHGLSLPDPIEKKFTLTEKQVRDMVTRVSIARMYQDGKNRSEIKKELNTSFDTIDRWKLTDLNDHLAFVENPRTGRKEISTQIENKIFQKRKNKHFSSRKAATELGISYKSVQNILNDAEANWRVSEKVTSIKEHHKKARLKFCKEHYNKDLSFFDKILITDSKIFTLHGGRNPRHHGRWVFAWEEVEHWGVDKFSPSLHVYGGMTSKGLTDLVFIHGSITGQRYVAEVLPTLLSVKYRINESNDVTCTKLFEDNDDWIFEQDHATSHDSAVAQNYLEENAPNFFKKQEVPAKLDDVWCIERIWAVMTYKVYGQGQGQPKSLDELKKRIIKGWKSLEVKMLRKAVHQMPLRMKEIIEKKGGRVTQFKESCDCELCHE